MDRDYRIALVLMALAGGVAASGCTSAQPDFSGHGIVFYCDGAGGGGITNWGRGVKQGLEEAGFNGTFDEFRWETGLGVIADQEEPVVLKRGRGKTMAKKIEAYASEFPGRPINLIGLSAGTAVVLYALEALPESLRVNDVVLLSCSVSSRYDLTAALRHVIGEMYVTTSQNDAILSDMVPAFGTADRKYTGEGIAGIHGFRMPAGAGPETRRLYSKVVMIAWNPEMERYGDYGGHTDTSNPRFIQHVIAPLIIREGPRYVRVHPRGTAGTYQASSSTE
jgi:pimeloyl-ACP methyl ester carboxylesterase